MDKDTHANSISMTPSGWRGYPPTDTTRSVASDWHGFATGDWLGQPIASGQ